MCLLVLAWNTHPRYRLVVAANRDEYHDRDAAPLGLWAAPTDILAGRDLRAGGTWMGIDRRRRFGIVTNFRDLVRAPPEAPSRGGLIPRYLGGAAGPGDYLAALEPDAPDYGGFNLLLADGESLWYASNRGTPFARELAPGVHGLSNEQLDTPWPKLLRVRRGFEEWLRNGGSAAGSELFTLLGDRTPATDEEGLPAPASRRTGSESSPPPSCCTRATARAAPRYSRSSPPAAATSRNGASTAPAPAPARPNTAWTPASGLAPRADK